MGKDRSNGTDAAVHNGVKQQPNRQMSTELYDISSKVQSLVYKIATSVACHTRVQNVNKQHYAVLKMN